MHIDSVHRDVRYPCDQFDFKAKHKSSLKTHKDSIHGVVRILVISVISRQNVKVGLKHMRTLFMEMWFTLEINVIIRRDKKDIFKKHIYSVHGDVSYLCDQYDYKAKRKGRLKTHIDSAHQNVRYPCNQCY